MTTSTQNAPLSAVPWYTRLVDWIACFRDKHQQDHSYRNYGKFRVQYRDGHWTERMSYSAACNYAECFGGTVHWIGKFDPVATGSRAGRS